MRNRYLTSDALLIHYGISLLFHHMATVKRRINISLPDDVNLALTRLAERDRVPQATKAASLLQLALEIEEDQIWDALAASRDRRGAKFISHKAAWS